jgi:hypothetical protein
MKAKRDCPRFSAPLQEAELTSCAKKVRAIILLALALVLPFAVFEIYVVTVHGFAEPYSYFFSVPLAVVSFLLVQLVVGYAVVKGWALCNMQGNYTLCLHGSSPYLFCFHSLGSNPEGGVNERRVFFCLRGILVDDLDVWGGCPLSIQSVGVP